MTADFTDVSGPVPTLILGPDTEPGASPPIYELECTGCLDTSGASEMAVDPQTWALDHASRTGHTGFRGVVTSFFRAQPAGVPALPAPPELRAPDARPVQPG